MSTYRVQRALRAVDEAKAEIQNLVRGLDAARRNTCATHIIESELRRARERLSLACARARISKRMAAS